MAQEVGFAKLQALGIKLIAADPTSSQVPCKAK
jgi:hypothetical protein